LILLSADYADYADEETSGAGRNAAGQGERRTARNREPGVVQVACDSAPFDAQRARLRRAAGRRHADPLFGAISVL